MSVSIYVDDSDVIYFRQEGQDILTMAESLEKKTGSVLITLSGKINHDSFSGFYDELAALVSVGARITLDLKDLTYIDPSGIKVLTRIQQQIEKKDREETLVLTNVPDVVLSALKEHGALDLLDIRT